MPWPPTTHQDVQDEVGRLRAVPASLNVPQYYHGLWTSGTMTTTTLNIDAVRIRPFMVTTRATFDRVAVNVATAATAGGVIRLGVYADAGSKPGALLHGTAALDSTTTGSKEEIISLTLDFGLYWVACVAQVASCVVASFPATLSTAQSWNISSNPPSSTSALGSSYVTSGVSGALPTPFPTAGMSGQAANPAIVLRAA